MTRHRLCGRVFHGNDSSILFSVSSLLRESILHKRSYDTTPVELLALCAVNILYHA